MHGTGSTARAQSECAEIHLVTEKAPEVQGGLEALQASARYPENARTAGVEGRVFVQFIVNTRGHATSPVVTRSVRADLDAEAVRVIRTARFTPGQQGGRAVCVQMSLPITFRPGMESASPVSSAPGVVTDATASVENTVSSVTNQVDETTDSVNSAASSVTQGVEDTNASISSTTREVSDAAASLKKTVGGLFGKKREADATSESGGLSTQSGSSSGSEMVGLADGDIVHAKVDNLELLTRPLGDAPTVTQVLTSDQLVYMGKEVNDFIFVQTSKGQGWINKLLVTKQ
jgi:TonB family protein